MDREQTAIERLKEAARVSERYYQKPVIITYSGGKDSAVILELAIRSGIDFHVMHNHTTVDAPETVRFVRQVFRNLEDRNVPCCITYPVYKGKPASMWSLIREKATPPTMRTRYCCDVLKESNNKGSYIVTGVRSAESTNRRNRGIYETQERNRKDKIILSNDNDDRRRLFERCAVKATAVCNPIIDWSDRDVWEYIRSEQIPVNPLYQQGFSRIGCIGCPMGNLKGRNRDFSRYPRYKHMYLLAFERMIQERKRRGLDNSGWETADRVFHWWMKDGVLPGQMEMELNHLEDEDETED